MSKMGKKTETTIELILAQCTVFGIPIVVIRVSNDVGALKCGCAALRRRRAADGLLAPEN